MQGNSGWRGWRCSGLCWWGRYINILISTPEAMLYHYTSFNALKSIVRAANSIQGLCFWATRFDCFVDEDEYKLGIEVINRLLPRLEERLNPGRRVASSFVWEEIKDNATLPFPYIVSFTDKNVNGYLWEEYAKRDTGVVLGLEDSTMVANDFTRNLLIKRCLYLGEKTEEELYKEIEDEYLASAYMMLTGAKKDLAFTFLSAYPQQFVALIGRYLLAYVAPRFKRNSFNAEEEIRAILAPPRIEMRSLIEQSGEALKAFNVNAEEVKRMIASEKKRTRDDGREVFYQELFLPGYLLKSVSVANEELIGPVNELLAEKGLDEVEVKKVRPV